MINLTKETYMVTQDSPTILKEGEAAKYLSVSTKTLQRWRFDHRGPDYVRFNNKLIRYPISLLNAWLDQHIITTADKKLS
jgi:predicted DNA-binding transcriptional regulator AlpA